MLFSALWLKGTKFLIENFAEVIDKTENFSNSNFSKYNVKNRESEVSRVIRFRVCHCVCHIKKSVKDIHAVVSLYRIRNY